MDFIAPTVVAGALIALIVYLVFQFRGHLVAPPSFAASTAFQDTVAED